MIPYGRQDITKADIKAVEKVLKSDFLTQGSTVPNFESSIIDYTGANFATAFNSATSALHISCLALGLGTNDILWTSPNSFVASANCGLYCGSKIDFVDIDETSLNISVEKLKEKLLKAKLHNKLPKVLVVVHFAGLSCEMREIKLLSKKYNFKIIEDASHAIGARYNNQAVGSCKYSDITVFSFHPVKIITSGEGGMALTNSKKIAFKLNLLRSHGITKDKKIISKKCPEDWFYEQIDLGLNYRMTDIHASLGLSQMGRLDKFVKRRHQIAKSYDEGLSDLPIIKPVYSNEINYSSLHLYPIQINTKYRKRDRFRLFSLLRGKKIGVNVHYIPIHYQPYYKKLGFKKGDFPVAEKYYDGAISIPIYYGLKKEQQAFVIKSIREYFGS